MSMVGKGSAEGEEGCCGGLRWWGFIGVFCMEQSGREA